MPFTIDLCGSVAILTGGSSGIGPVTARMLLEAFPRATTGRFTDIPGGHCRHA